jgi:hypothetical protein
MKETTRNVVVQQKLEKTKEKKRKQKNRKKGKECMHVLGTINLE